MWRRRHVSDMSRGRPMDGRAGEPTATDVLSGFHAHFGPLALSYAALALTRLATRLLHCRRKCRAPVTVFYASRSAQHPARWHCPQPLGQLSGGRGPATVGGARAAGAVPASLFEGRRRGSDSEESPSGRDTRAVAVLERVSTRKTNPARGPVASGPAPFRLRDDPRKKTGMAFTRVESYE